MHEPFTAAVAFVSVALIPFFLVFWTVLRMSEVHPMTELIDPHLNQLVSPRVRLFEPGKRELRDLLCIEVVSFPSGLPDFELWDAKDLDGYLEVGAQIAVYESPKPDEGITGYVMYFVAENQGAEILRLAVAPRFRRRGIATALLNWVRQRAIESNAEKITCDVFEDRLEMQLLLKSQGFVYQAKVNDDYPEVEGIDMYRFLLATDKMCDQGSA